MRPPTVAAACAVALLAAPAATAQAPPPDAPDPAIADGSAQRALDAARERWQAGGRRSYRFRVSLLCFCPEGYRAPRTLTVRRGRPVDPPRHLRQVATVPRLFRVVQEAIDRGVAGLGVTYGAHGLPRSISIDVSRMIADEETAYRVSRLRSLG
jgi:hypothetical protein